MALLPKWFTIWYFVSSIVLFIRGIVNIFMGNTISPGSMNPLAASIGVFTMYLIVLLVWKYRKIFQINKRLIPKVPFTSVLVGWFFAMIGEIINWPFNPLQPGMSLLGDLATTTPFYIFMHLSWFYVLKRFRFTPSRALIVGGLSGGIAELLFGGNTFSILLTVILFPFVVMIHGVHMVMPKIFLEKYFEKLDQKDTPMKYFWGTLLPLCGLIIGIGVSVLISSAYSL